MLHLYDTVIVLDSPWWYYISTVQSAHLVRSPLTQIGWAKRWASRASQVQAAAVREEVIWIVLSI